MCNPKVNSLIKVNVHNRKERESIMSDMQLKHNAMLSMLDGFNGRGDTDITKKDLQSFSINEWVSLNDKVKVKRLDNLVSDLLVFRTLMESGGEFGWHLHSDCDEYLYVLKGALVDLGINKKYEENEMAFIGKGTPHIPVAIEQTELIVFFK